MISLALFKNPLHRFIFAVLFWLPLCFALWYFLAYFYLIPLTGLTEQLFNVWMPEALLWLRLEENTLIIASNFGEDTLGNIVSPPSGHDLLGFEVNPLIYGYSLPLLLALLLATPQPNKGKYLLYGAIIMSLVQLFSMTISVLKTLTFDVGLAFQQQQNMSVISLNLVALFYQMVVLILPMITPLIIWMLLSRQFLFYLAPKFKQSFST